LDRAERAGRAPGFIGPHLNDFLKRFRRGILQPHGADALRMLHDCGALESFFPELRDIEAWVIRDFYHRYTVDEHTLVAIQGVLNLRAGATGGKKGDPFAELAAETEDFDLLALALLFHDVGKGTEGESHVISSARIAATALRRAGISDRAMAIVHFLIAAHL